MQATAGSAKKYVRTGAIVLLALALGLAAYRGLAKHRQTYQSRDGAYSVEYPENWEPVVSNGIVTFYQKNGNTEYKTNVTIVISAMAPDWRQDFEASLANAFAAIGAKYALLENAQLSLQGRPVNSYTYSLSMDGRNLQNTVYVFEIGKNKAAVITCSGLAPRDAALEAQFKMFAETFHRN
jgi:hypothetical protein